METCAESAVRSNIEAVRYLLKLPLTSLNSFMLTLYTSNNLLERGDSLSRISPQTLRMKLRQPSRQVRLSGSGGPAQHEPPVLLQQPHQALRYTPGDQRLEGQRGHGLEHYVQGDNSADGVPHGKEVRGQQVRASCGLPQAVGSYGVPSQPQSAPRVQPREVLLEGAPDYVVQVGPRCLRAYGRVGYCHLELKLV